MSTTISAGRFGKVGCTFGRTTGRATGRSTVRFCRRQWRDRGGGPGAASRGERAERVRRCCVSRVVVFLFESTD